MTFRVFDAASGGNELWSETQTNVPVERGVFSVILGEGTAIPDSVFADFTSTWLELTLEGPQTLTPRTRITSVGYAYTSTYSDTAEYAKAGAADNDWTVDGNNMYSAVPGSVGVGVTNPAEKLDVDGAINTSSFYKIEGNTMLSYVNLNNTLVGVGAGENTTASGINNTFLGDSAGFSNTSGNNNTFLGHNAGHFNTVSNNTFIGTAAGAFNTTGTKNTFFGFQSGLYNTTGQDNTFSGYEAGLSNTTGYGNTFTGTEAGYHDTSGFCNTFTGYIAGYSNVDGFKNTFSGHGAGYNNTAGRHNTFTGNEAGYYNNTGMYNVFTGGEAGFSNISGISNTFIGYGAGYYNTEGDSNVFVGHHAGFNETGSNMLYIANGQDDANVLIYGEFDNRRVGIGTTSPTQELHVQGNARITGAVCDNNNETGTSGQVLSSTGSGIDWVDVAADNDWTVSGNVLYPSSDYGLSMRSSNALFGTYDTTHVCFGTACTTGVAADSHPYCTVGGGKYNIAYAYSTIPGGYFNHAYGFFSNIGGGYSNTVDSGVGSVIAGGGANAITGDYSVIPGGYNNAINADYSFLFGIRCTLSTDSTLMVDLPHIRFGDESSGYEFPLTDGNSGEVMVTDGSSQLNWAMPQDTDWVISGSDMYSNVSGAVGIGTISPLTDTKFHVNAEGRYAGYFTSDSLDDSTHVIHAEFTGSGYNDAVAVYGKSMTEDGYGIGGYFAGGHIGVQGIVDLPGNVFGQYHGVYGVADADTGHKYGVYGIASGHGWNRGVYGRATSGTHENYGVYGYASGSETSCRGMYGQALGSGGNVPAIGIEARAQNRGSGFTYGGMFVADSGSSPGSGTAYGLYVVSHGAASQYYNYGIYCRVRQNAPIPSYGAYFDVINLAGSTSYGVRIENTVTNSVAAHHDSYGIHAEGEISGAGEGYGIYAVGTHNGSGQAYGGYFTATTAGGTAYAGYFSGDVHITGALSKGSGSFLIDHPLDPENKTLRHNFVESPENLCLYRGKIKLNDRGEAQVQMPDYFAALTRENEATITLTSIGKPFNTGYEWHHDFTEFTVYGEPNREISYIVLADRDDPVMQQLHRPVEEEKGGGNFEKGKLLYAEAYGYPREMSIDYGKQQTIKE